MAAKKAPAKKSPPGKSLRREGAIVVLMDPDERALVDAGAKHAGMGVGTWLRAIGIEKARELIRRTTIVG